MTAGIKKPGGNSPSKYQQFIKASVLFLRKVDKIGLRKNNTLANCSCLLDYGVGEDYKEGKPKDL